MACTDGYALECTDWLNHGHDNPICQYLAWASFNVIKPGKYTIFINDFINIPLAVGYSLKMKQVPPPPSGE